MDYRQAEEERQLKRLSINSLDPVKVRSLTDIKSVISSLLNAPNTSSVKLSTNFRTTKEDIKLTVDTKSKTQRDLIIDGLTDIRSKELCVSAEAEVSSVNGISIKPARIPDQKKAYHKVDPIISRYTGGYRDGYMICWNLNDGYKYSYDIFEHKLSREATVSTSSGTV